MPTNTKMESCVASERGALVFWSPRAAQHRPNARVQIVDVFALQVATGYTRDPQGRLLIEAQPSVAAGRSWSLAKAAQLIRNDARPQRSGLVAVCSTAGICWQLRPVRQSRGRP
jgi:hypothetical protein